MHAKSIRVVIHKESAAIEKPQLLSFPFFRHRFFISSIFAIPRRRFQRDPPSRLNQRFEIDFLILFISKKERSACVR